MVQIEKGFTLSEVLVALVVLSLGLLALESMHLAAIQVNTVAKRLTQATTLAQERAELLMALPYNDPTLTDTTSKGSFTSYTDSQPPQGYTIRWEVDTDAPSGGIKTINIYVTWKNKASPPKSFNLAVQKSII